MTPLDAMLVVLAVLVIYALLAVADEIKRPSDNNGYNNESGVKPDDNKGSP